MISTPSDLAHFNQHPGSTDQVGWYVSPRPEGQRCLVTAHNGETVARDKNGVIIGKFQSNLPSGSKKRRNQQKSGGDGYSILDCILQEEPPPPPVSASGRRPAVQRTYWVLDVMCWKGYSLYDCNLHFRSYWLQTKLAEGMESQQNSPWTVFQPVPRYECTTEGVRQAYSTNTYSTHTTDNSHNMAMKTDGLLFMHRNGHYDPGPLPTPLVLVWKDATCGAAHYVHSGSTATEAIILRVGNGRLLTQDNVQLGVVDVSTDSDYQQNDLLRFQIEGVRIENSNSSTSSTSSTNSTNSNSGGQQRPVLIQPKYMGKCSKHRAAAHTMARILFHHGGSESRSVTVPSVETLVQVVSNPIVVDTTKTAAMDLEEEGEDVQMSQ